MAEQGAQLPNSYESMYERAQALARSGDPGAATEVLERILARLGRLSDETLRQNQGLASFAYRVGLDLSGLLAGRGSYDQAAAVIGALPRFAPDEVANLERRAALVLADADVDAANLELLVSPELLESHDFVGGRVADIDPDLCRNCELCTVHCFSWLVGQLGSG